ncbi:hypothetical protein PSHT_10528 [Puccinia striiformis]|uniref:DUF6589 domain-containing protein n=1 Tax=Puccinia striiformis TaxID=27350 RepID=A0A2S4V9C4_9BASI|nr:hypothetical protein PSHT_10528 [Puccinia striiformis]
MPFLYNILLGTLSQGSADEALDEEQQTTKALDEAVESDEISGSDHLEIPDKTGGIADEERHKNPRDRALQQARRVSPLEALGILKLPGIVLVAEDSDLSNDIPSKGKLLHSQAVYARKRRPPVGPNNMHQQHRYGAEGAAVISGKQAYQDAIRKVEQLRIELTMFLPSPGDKDVQYYNSAIPTEPPTMEKISHEKANIQILKLMDASDNSVKGVGQVFQSILQQSGLTEDMFYTKLQPMDGDLGRVANFNCLRLQRMPAELPEDSLNNIQFQLGASHTLWNVASSISTHHFGNPKDNTDGGAWQYLKALGFPAEKAIQKKNFTLMVNQMERVFEATIYYCLRVVMKTATKKMFDQPAIIPTARCNRIVDKCYDRFCSVEARDSAAAGKCPQLSNT